ncbi:Response regulator receiver sensor signal transduction histidine kinase [Hyella patelloides LEGE 07179]|uniref:histidine kinase n=1 Tax=Hyella patelloides LEGE 07179 TaxID=945734 RepID=A0A563VSE0_9CYAN|nr:response regulator [Hyella patelloides]VEP14374.1 Response regulator receiver sensor signal transduction histidine kinase [Hyella patelloides LEGE 07179]
MDFTTNSEFNAPFNLKDHNILIVDDNPTNLSVIVDYLEDYGLTILVSQDGESSLKRAKYAKPSIILLDILMPGIDGYETCRRLKNESETKDIPIIFMTALSSTEDKIKGFEVGAVDCVTKPIQPEEVLARIKLHLRLRHMSHVQIKQNDALIAEIEHRKIIQKKLSLINHRLKQEASNRIKAQQALKKLNEDLESRVKERTVLLAKSNQQLKQEVLEHQQTEIKLKNSLVEKEVLLKEIYHRVKNNLLVVASLLEMQASYIDEPEIIKMFKNSQERIYSMALVHEQLYRSDNLQEIDLSIYIKDLLAKISDSHVNQNKSINIEVNTESINLNIETAHSCGLIINELITNALEHAFVDREKGNVWINLLRTDNAEIILTIKDDGMGVPKDFDFNKTDSLGLRLVRILTRQLEGDIEVDFSQGTSFQLTFSELDYCERL